MVTLLTKVLRLDPRDRQLLFGTVWLVAVVRIALWLLPFPVVHRALAAASKRPRRYRPPDEACGRVAWAVERACRCIPGATCLPQALTADYLLCRLGQRSQLKIGVAKDTAGKFLAHAWVESDGRVVVGRLPNLSSYRVLNARTSRSQ